MAIPEFNLRKNPFPETNKMVDSPGGSPSLEQIPMPSSSPIASSPGSIITEQSFTEGNAPVNTPWQDLTEWFDSQPAINSLTTKNPETVKSTEEALGEPYKKTTIATLAPSLGIGKGDEDNPEGAQVLPEGRSQIVTPGYNSNELSELYSQEDILAADPIDRNQMYEHNAMIYNNSAGAATLPTILEDGFWAMMRLGDLRKAWAQDNAEYEYNIGDNRYTDEDLNSITENENWVFTEEGQEPTLYAGYQFPDGSVVSLEDYNNAEYYTWTPAPGEESLFVDEDGNPIAMSDVSFPNGVVVSPEDFLNKQNVATEEPNDNLSPVTRQYQDASGNILYTNDLLPEDAGGNLTYEQSNLWRGRLNAAEPESPLGDLGDILPWLVDTTLFSAPFFNKYTRYPATAAMVYPALTGMDISSADWRTQSFADDDLSLAQQTGQALMTPVDVAAERLGGLKAGPRMFKNDPAVAKILNKLPSYDKLPSGVKALVDVVGSGAEEGLEEFVATPFEILAKDGFANFARSSSLDENGNRIYDEDSSIGDTIPEELLENFVGGAVMGGALSTPGSVKNAITSRNRYVPPTPASIGAINVPEAVRQLDEQYIAARQQEQG